jgi:hypothetical protein
MSFFKHVGVANNKKVIIVQRQLSGDDEHMAAILYSDILPTRYHDDVMKVLESTEGQAAYEFRDILQRRMMADGQNMLQMLSSENYIKRVAQNAIIVKPNSKSSIRLDELNKLLREAGRGDQAVKRLDEMDAQLGMNSDPTKTKSARNKANNSPEVDIHYGEDDGGMTPSEKTTAVEKTQIDQTALMMQMMQTMQQMQKELAEMKNPTAAKKPVVRKTPKSKTTAV